MYLGVPKSKLIIIYFLGKAPYSPVIEIDDDSHSKFIQESSRQSILKVQNFSVLEVV